MDGFKVTRTPDSNDGVVHIRAASQELLTRMFVRPSEFYESPFDDIRGKYFTLEKYAARYAAANDGVMSYYTDWHGFNIPGHVVRAFFLMFFDRTTEAERFILDSIKGMHKFYLIGSHDGDDKEDALDHELCHASFYLDDRYREHAKSLAAEFRNTVSADKLIALLKEWGYSDTVMDDEINAYLATTETEWWLGEGVDADLATDLWLCGKPFRALAKEFNTGKWLANV